MSTATATTAVTGAVELAERGLVPDAVIRLGIRRLLVERLREVGAGGPEERQERFEELVADLARAPVAVATAEANEQHYEVPADFFRLTLGERLKYSACLWPDVEAGTGPLDAPEDGLDEAERRMLEITARRAGIEDGDRVLELGCGWGSLTLWLAERFPRCRITAVSNSASQRRFIEERCRELGIETVRVVTADVSHLDLGGEASAGFDRVVSVEMFEHVRNHPALLQRVHDWLRPGGTLFVHVFCHRRFPYLFEATDDPGDWMARTFFTGGIMPSPELVLRWQGRLQVRRQWLVDGRHYERTARAWLANLDRRRERVRRVLAEVHGEEAADRWVGRWRIFFLAVAELFGYRKGSEWMVSHTLFERPRQSGGEWS